jgi:putative iron-regulated protein
MLLAQGGEGVAGGEGGDGTLPLTYALPVLSPGDYQYDAKPEIDAYAAGAHANYQAAAAEVAKLKAAVDALLATPSDETLAAARAAWVAARPAYLVTETYRFYDGPIEAIEGEINSGPINEAFIDYVEGAPDSGIVNQPDTEVSVASLMVRNQVSDETDVTLGWHAIEFLLWGQDLSATGPGARPVADYAPGVANDDRRRAYLKIATDRLAAGIGRLAQAWAPGQPDNYAAIFAALEPREAIGRIMNGLAVLAGSELMSERMAVGLDSGDQEDEHSCFSDTTHQDFVYDMQGMANVWTGTYPGYSGPGIRELAARVDAPLAAEVDGLVADAVAKIAALGDPWDQVLASPPGSPERA